MDCRSNDVANSELKPFSVITSVHNLDREALIRILTEPRNALIKQYIALMDTEGIALTFTVWSGVRLSSFCIRSSNACTSRRPSSRRSTCWPCASCWA